MLGFLGHLSAVKALEPLDGAVYLPLQLRHFLQIVLSDLNAASQNRHYTNRHTQSIIVNTTIFIDMFNLSPNCVNNVKYEQCSTSSNLNDATLFLCEFDLNVAVQHDYVHHPHFINLNSKW